MSRAPTTREARRLATLAALQTPIAAAVEPQRFAAMERVEAYARQHCAKLVTALAAQGFDLNAVAPRPSGQVGRFAYWGAQSLRESYMAITKTRERTTMAHIHGSAPQYVDIVPEKIEAFVHDAREQASRDYDAFIMKLCAKVGSHSGATLTGDHVWGYSLLRVLGTDGAVSLWKTQQITNVSKYGKVFAQWPTRKQK